MSRSNGQPTFRVRCFYPKPGQYGLSMARFPDEIVALEDSGTYYAVDFDDDFQAFNFGEKIADADRIIVVVFLDWRGVPDPLNIGKHWVLPWATKWTEHHGWGINAFENFFIQ